MLRSVDLSRATNAVRLGLLASLLLLVVAACSPGPGASPSSAVTLRPLPISAYGDGHALCAGSAHPGPIRLVDAGGSVVGDDGTHQFAIRWPSGYRAVYGRAFLGVVTNTGSKFADAGDDINTQSGIFNGHVICYGPLPGIDVWPEGPQTST
jgi:hypothetical protein